MAPIIKVIVLARVVNISRKCIRTGERAALPGMNGIGLAATCSFSLAATHDHERGVSIFAGLKAVLAGTQDGKRLIGRIHFKYLVAAEPLHADIESSFRELDLNGAVVQVEEGKASAAV